FNNTNINNAAFGVNGLGDRILHVMWTGVKYAVTDEVDVIAAYYHYIQNSFFGTPAGAAPCSGSARSQCAGALDAYSAVIDWKFAPKWDLYFGVMFSQENGGLANGFLQRNNIDPTVGLGDAPDFVEVGEAGIAMDDAMRRQRRVQLVG